MCIFILTISIMPAARVSPAVTDRQSSQHKSLQSSGESCSSECPSLQDDTEFAPDAGKDTEEEDIDLEILTPYQRAIKKLQTDGKWLREVSLGKRIGLYRIKEELGSGNFSQVRAGVHSLTKERVAIKILDKAKLDNKTQKMLSREVESMESLHHPNVIRLYEVLETLSKIYLVMEHASGGELFHRISQNGQFTERGAKPIFAQIIAAVDHMHLHNVIHRDLKAENVFFASTNLIKVGDFGFSTRIKDSNEALRTFCGSPPYAAPELFRDDSYIGPMVDIWALGVLFYFMLTATMPFKAQTVSGLKKQILEGEYDVPVNLSKECQFLITGILKLDPKSRLTLEQIKNSDWLSGWAFPGALPKDNIQVSTEICREKGPSLIPEEISARNRLLELGIAPEMLEEAKTKGSRSAIVGTYRIVLLKFLTESNPFVYEIKKLPPTTYQFLKREEPKKKHEQRKSYKPRKNKKSKLCIIL